MTFIDQIKPYSILMFNLYSVLPSLTMCQAVLESADGTSELATQGNNLFGVKWTDGCGYDKITLPTDEYENGKWITIQADFRKYPDFKESIRDHAKLLQLPRYSDVLKAANSTDAINAYHEADKSVWKAGYATDPNYPSKLDAIVQKYGFNEIDNSILGWENRQGVQAVLQLSKTGKIDSPEMWLSKDLKDNTPLWLTLSFEARR